MERDFLLTRKKLPFLTTEKVKNTDSFKALNKIQQKIVKSYNNIKLIQTGLSIVSHKGFDKFEREHNYSWANLMIIKELSKN